MPGSVRIELNYAGVGQLLKSAPVQAMLLRKGQAVASAASSRGVTVDNPPTPVPVNVLPASGGSRARVLVTVDHPAGLAVEVKHRLLGGSLNAGG